LFKGTDLLLIASVLLLRIEKYLYLNKCFGIKELSYEHHV